jgi:hypothetical protein
VRSGSSKLPAGGATTRAEAVEVVAIRTETTDRGADLELAVCDGACVAAPLDPTGDATGDAAVAIDEAAGVVAVTVTMAEATEVRGRSLA